MAITFGNTSSGVSGDSHNNNGTFIDVSVTSTTNDVSGVTYNSVSMTSRGVVSNVVSGRFISLWTLNSPAAGSNAVNISGGSNVAFRAQSYSGAATNPVTSVTTSGSTGTPATLTTAVWFDGGYVIAHGQCRDFSSNGTNTSTLNTGGAINTLGVWRNTSAISPAGNGTITINTTGSEWDLIGYALNVPFSITAASVAITGQAVGTYYITYSYPIEPAAVAVTGNYVRISFADWADESKSSTAWANRQEAQ